MKKHNGIVIYSFEDEENRLRELIDFNLLYTSPEKTFDRITQMVSNIMNMPIVLISLITPDRQWFKSCFGLDDEKLLKEGTGREISFCQYVVAHKEAMIVHDMTKDERFVNNPFVTGEPLVRFYAGAPLITRSNNILGTLCVLDTKSRSFSSNNMELLQQFADIVMDEIELRDEIAQRKKVEQSLRESEERYKNLVELSPDMILVYQRHSFVYANPESKKFFFGREAEGPYSVDEVTRFIHPDDRDEFIRYLQQGITQKRFSPIQYQCRLPSETSTDSVDVLLRSSKIFYNGKKSVLLIARDISAQKKAERQAMENNRKLLEMSMQDGLTGIPNRRKLEEYLEANWQQAVKSGKPLSVLLIDIDCFKAFNDTYGHLAGDHCLIEVAKTILLTLNESTGLASRYGGEEFAVILPDTDLNKAFQMAERMRQNVENLNILHEKSVSADKVTISLGIATMFPKTDDCHLIIETADRALYNSKKSGRNCVTVLT